MTKDDIIADILPSAVLSASAHNTQPWKFRVSENLIEIYIDWERHLEISDPTLRQLYISLGCVIANIRAAAAHRGHKITVEPAPEDDEKEMPAARILFSEGKDPSAAPFSAIAKRRTNRFDFLEKPLTSAEKSVLKTTANSAVLLIEDKAKIAELAEISGEAQASTLARKDFKQELTQWIRSSYTKQPDGMPGYAAGIPGPVSLIAPFVMKIAPIHKQEGPKLTKQINQASAMLVITAQKDNPVEWLRAGELLEQLWLETTAAGLDAMPIVGPVEAGGDFPARLKAALATNREPMALLRIGHSVKKNLRPTPRRSVQNCLMNV